MDKIEILLLMSNFSDYNVFLFFFFKSVNDKENKKLILINQSRKNEIKF
jgi:hypothetical protein